MTKINLERNQKIAFARIISDLIEADFIVEEGEMRYFEKIMSKEEGFNIKEAMLIEAKKMRFADAVSLLKELDSDSRKEIVKKLKDLAMADGTCVPLEAIQIFALEHALEHDATVYSVPAENIGIDNMKVIYIENEDNTLVAKEIEANLRSICNEFALAGFDFVLIPHVVHDYSVMKRDYLKNVVKYMIPSLPEEKIESICEQLCSMTTSSFCNNILYKKIDIPLKDAKPSLLIKINESVTQDLKSSETAVRTNYANFLQIKLDVDVLTKVRTLLDNYRAMINAPVMVQSKPITQKFLYYGFHRALFDLIAFDRERKEYILYIDLTGHKAKVYFQAKEDETDRFPLGLNPQETTLYTMIVKKSWNGPGLDWRVQRSKEERIALMEEYNKIYKKIGKSKTTTDYKDAVQTNHIRESIRKLNCIANAEMFLPENYKEGKMSYYRVLGSPKDIIIME